MFSLVLDKEFDMHMALGILCIDREKKRFLDMHIDHDMIYRYLWPWKRKKAVVLEWAGEGGGVVHEEKTLCRVMKERRERREEKIE